MASQPQPGVTATTPDEAIVFKELDDYDWDADAEFQTGLQAILGSTADPTRAEHLTLRARCFYFSRKRNLRIDFNRYLSWRAPQAGAPAISGFTAEFSEPSSASAMERKTSVAQQHGSTADSSEPPAPYPTSFEQIVELISTGKPIPGIKEVPSTVLQGQASQTSVAQRRKPWEKDNETVIRSEISRDIELNS